MSKKASELAVAYNVEDETRFELEEYASDEEASRAQSSSKISPSQGLSSASLQLMEKLVADRLRPCAVF